MNQKRKFKLSDRMVEYIITRETPQLAHLTCQEIAEAFGIEPDKIYNTFESELRITLEKFITREKLHRCLFQLDKEPSLAVEDMAQRIGYNELGPFSREFEDYMLISPERYREISH